MRILDRYIFKNVLSTICVCLLTFIFLYVIIDAFSHLEDFLRQKVSPVLLVQYYLSYLPIIFTEIAPFSCLLSVLYTFARLNRNNEIIAMRASGLSILQICNTALVLGVVISLAVFWVNDRFVPHSQAVTQKIKEQIEGGSKKETDKGIINNLSMYGLKNRLYFVNKFSIPLDTMEGIIILEHDAQQNITKKIIASQGVFRDGLWHFSQCITYEFDAQGQIKGEARYAEEEIMEIPETPQDFLHQRQQPESMSIAELNEYIWKLSKSGATSATRRLTIELYRKFTKPLTSLVIIILAIPFALIIKKRATGMLSFGASIIMGFLYYVLDAISLALGYGGILSPGIAVSLSHLIVLSFSVYMMKTLP